MKSSVGFWGEGKTGVPGDKPLRAERKTNTWRREQKLNIDHMGGRELLSHHKANPASS